MGNIFLTVRSLSLFLIVVSSGATAMASSYSVWGLRYEPWHGRCVSKKLKKIDDNDQVKNEKYICSHLALAVPIP
jgi:hypothetical protein